MLAEISFARNVSEVNYVSKPLSCAKRKAHAFQRHRPFSASRDITYVRAPSMDVLDELNRC